MPSSNRWRPSRLWEHRKALLDGRFKVSFDDVRTAALPALRHRLILSFEGEAEGMDPDAILEDLLKRVPTPGNRAAALTR